MLDRAIGPLLGSGILVSLNTSANSQTYFAQIASAVISYTRGRTGGKLITHTCLVLKAGSGVSCTPPAAKTTTTGTTTTTTSSTTSTAQ